MGKAVPIIPDVCSSDCEAFSRRLVASPWLLGPSSRRDQGQRRAPGGDEWWRGGKARGVCAPSLGGEEAHPPGHSAGSAAGSPLPGGPRL